jgi:hypothetical protein
MGRTIGGKTVSNGLVLALDAANKRSYPGSGTAWKDLSGNNNTGTLTNGPTFSAANLGSIVFDGTNDGVDVLNNFGSIQNNVTFETFVKLNGSQNSKIFVSNYTQVSGASGCGIGIQDGVNNVVKFFTGNLGTTNTLYSTTTLSNNVYYHIVGTYNGSSKILYVNANNEASTTISNAINNTSALASIGYVTYLSAQYLNGNIAIARIYNRALSATEVLQNYNVNKSRFGL